MKTITKTYQVYDFNELSDTAKNNVRYNLSPDWLWYDFIEEQFTEDMAACGIEVSNMYFSGFGGQGDGACFIGEVNAMAFLKAQKITKAYWLLYTNLLHENADALVHISHSGRYYHSGTMVFAEDLSIYQERLEMDDNVYTQWESLVKAIKAFCINKAKELYTQLEKEYEYLLSDEHLSEMAEANEWHFFFFFELI